MKKIIILLVLGIIGAYYYPIITNPNALRIIQRKMEKLGLVASQQSFGEGEEDSYPVITLTNLTFHEEIKKHDNILVLFYDKRCQACIKFAPVYQKAAQTLLDKGIIIPLANIDGHIYSLIASPNQINSYPTLLLFKKGKRTLYTGGQSEEDIVSWVTKKALSPTQHLKSLAEFKELTQANKVVIVYTGISEKEVAYNEFFSVANFDEQYVYAHTFNRQLTSALNSSSGSVILFKQYDEGRNDFKGNLTVESINEFIQQNVYPNIMEFDDTAQKRIFFKNNEKSAFLLFHNSTEKCLKALEAVKEQARLLKGGNTLFAASILGDGLGSFKKMAEFLGIKITKLPQLIFVHFKWNLEKYQYTEEITTQNIQNFLQRYKDGKLEIFKKSEEIPEKNDGAVKIVVANNYKDLVLNNDKDVLLEFYAPWCGHCKTLAPKYQAAAEKIKHNPNLIIAKCDGNANEVEGIFLQSYPTILFYPGHLKNQTNQGRYDYNGTKDEAGILKWLKQHVTYPWVDEITPQYEK